MTFWFKILENIIALFWIAVLIHLHLCISYTVILLSAFEKGTKTYVKDGSISISVSQ